MPHHRIRLVTAALAFACAAAACSTADSTPSTTVASSTPADTAGRATTPVITSIDSSNDPRLQEIRELATDLTMRRLLAFYELDREGLAEVDGRPELLEEDLTVIDDGGLEFATEPNIETVPYKILEVIVDDRSCLVVRSRIDLTNVLTFFAPSQQIDVFWVDGASASFAEVFPTSATAEDWEPICAEAP